MNEEEYIDPSETEEEEKEAEDSEAEKEGSEAHPSFCETLTEYVHDEWKDSGKYVSLAKLADEEYPGEGYGAILRDIAKEEAIHLKHLQEILSDINLHK